MSYMTYKGYKIEKIGIDCETIDVKRYGGTEYRFYIPGQSITGYGTTVEHCKELIRLIHGDPRYYRTAQIKPGATPPKA